MNKTREDWVFILEPVNHEKETLEYISRTEISRWQMDPIVNYAIHGTNPVIYSPTFKNSYRLKHGNLHRIES